MKELEEIAILSIMKHFRNTLKESAKNQSEAEWSKTLITTSKHSQKGKD
jgi:hypothetical protein